MRLRILIPFLLAGTSACGRGGNPPDAARLLADESARFIEGALPGVSWARSGGGGGTGVSQRSHQLRTVEPLAAEAAGDLLARLRERVLAVLADLGANVHGRGTSEGPRGLESFQLRFDVGRARGTYVAWSVRLEDGRQAVFITASHFR